VREGISENIGVLMVNFCLPFCFNRTQNIAESLSFPCHSSTFPLSYVALTVN
jgi:hypothetical protein